MTDADDATSPAKRSRNAANANGDIKPSPDSAGTDAAVAIPPRPESPRVLWSPAAYRAVVATARAAAAAPNSNSNNNNARGGYKDTGNNNDEDSDADTAAAPGMDLFPLEPANGNSAGTSSNGNGNAPAAVTETVNGVTVTAADAAAAAESLSRHLALVRGLVDPPRDELLLEEALGAWLPARSSKHFAAIVAALPPAARAAAIAAAASGTAASSSAYAAAAAATAAAAAEAEAAAGGASVKGKGRWPRVGRPSHASLAAQAAAEAAAEAANARASAVAAALAANTLAARRLQHRPFGSSCEGDDNNPSCNSSSSGKAVNAAGGRRRRGRSASSAAAAAAGSESDEGDSDDDDSDDDGKARARECGHPSCPRPLCAAARDLAYADPWLVSQQPVPAPAAAASRPLTAAELCAAPLGHCSELRALVLLASEGAAGAEGARALLLTRPRREESERVQIDDESEDVCFQCGDGGNVMICDAKRCGKVYHPLCVGLDKVPSGEWQCPRHRCTFCHMPVGDATRMCQVRRGFRE